MWQWKQSGFPMVVQAWTQQCPNFPPPLDDNKKAIPFSLRHLLKYMHAIFLKRKISFIFQMHKSGMVRKH